MEPLLGVLRGCLEGPPDKRRGLNTRYSMGDIGMAVFSVLCTQSPSILAHQRQLDEGHKRSNCETLFGIDRIPSDNPTAPCSIRPRRPI